MKTCVAIALCLGLAGQAAAQGAGWAKPDAADPKPEPEAKAAAPAAPSGAGSWGAAPAETAEGHGFTPEEQVATGRFLTALEVKPILAATEANWVAVRAFNGQDLLYFTHLLAWRCGLFEIRYAVNGGAEQVFPAEPCYVDTNAPNAIKAETVLPYLTFPLGSVAEVEISLLYDDGTTGSARFARSSILMP